MVKNYLSTEQVKQLAKNLHQTQKMKNGKNYFGHILKVAENAEVLFYKMWPRTRTRKVNHNFLIAHDAVIQTALLHDTLEDCCDQGVLERLGVHPEVIRAVKLLTKPDNKTNFNYHTYLKRIKSNMIARIVKMADLEHNSKLSRAVSIASTKDLPKLFKRHLKYLASYIFLEAK